MRDVRLLADPEAGFDPAHAARIRAAALEVFTRSPVALAVPAPTGDLLVRMMSHCLGEEVAPEYAPMIAADLGFSDRHDAQSSADGAPDVVVIGAEGADQPHIGPFA